MSIFAALLLMVTLATIAALAIGLSATRSAGSRDERTLIDDIDALLPQTQCGRCTFTGCRPYAMALARGEADINQCPPGGEQTMTRLAGLLGRAPRPVDDRFGIVPASPYVAWIDEPRCIGCTKCIQACPVDAIVGASKYMHTVIAEDCTGCELCIPPCPVDCIEMRPAPPAGVNSPRRAFPRTALTELAD
jgi:Na+-translocating ferredoxin:NAD+ oxidoreductase subunit B